MLLARSPTGRRRHSQAAGRLSLTTPSVFPSVKAPYTNLGHGSLTTRVFATTSGAAASFPSNSHSKRSTQPPALNMSTSPSSRASVLENPPPFS